MTREEFLAALDARIAERDLLKHPFYRAWMEGNLSLEDLQIYAAQYWQQVWAFPVCLSALHTRMTDIDVRREVARNLAEEEGGEKSHPQMWLQFGEGVGITAAEMEATAPLPETRGLVETFRYLSHRASWPEAVAAFYAQESQAPAVSVSKAEGLRRLYGISDDETLEYFTVHAEADVEHAAAWRRLLGSGCRDDMGRAAAIAAAGRAADALWHLLDGVLHARRARQALAS